MKYWLSILLCIFMVNFSEAAISFDANASATGVGNISWTHTCASNATVLVVGVNNNGGSTSAVSYNSISLIRIDVVSYHSATGEASLWYLVSPTSGSNSVNLTTTGGSAGLQGGSISLIGTSLGIPSVSSSAI